MRHLPILRALLLALAALWAAACSRETPMDRQYESVQAGVRFIAAPGWTVAEKTAEGCSFSVEAAKSPDLKFLICVSPPRPDILFTQNAFVSCENIAQYIREALKGLKPVCKQGGAGPHTGYETLYARLVRSDAKVRVQFVNHVFYPVKGRLVQVMAIALGDDEQAAQALYEEHARAFDSMLGSIRLR